MKKPSKSQLRNIKLRTQLTRATAKYVCHERMAVLTLKMHNPSGRISASNALFGEGVFIGSRFKDK